VKLLVLLAVVTCTSGCITVSFKSPVPESDPIGNLACGIAAGFDPVGVTAPVALSICGASVLYDLGRSIEIRLAQSEVRIDKFDQRGKRLGYDVFDPRTGRVDSYDSRQRHTGHGYVVTPPNCCGVTDADRQRWRERELEERKR